MNDALHPVLKLADTDLAQGLARVCTLIRQAGGRAWLVGGCVRDNALGLSVRDLDVEVFGLSADDLQATLTQSFTLDLVGRSFGIIKLKGLSIDVGLPRRESKVGLGHRGFSVHSDPFLPLSVAASRRDFTINAMYLDPLTGELEDPTGGQDDLKKGILRHTSDAFDEDPLRVLRAMQMVARFNLTVAPDTTQRCRQITTEGLPPERLFGEWVKLLTLGLEPSRGLAFLHDCRWLKYYPELAALQGCPQDPRWHPEGDVWTHTLHCLDAFAAERIGDPWEDLVVGLAVLCHDLGKPATTRQVDDRISTAGHDSHGVDVTEQFLGRLTQQQRLIQDVVVLVAEHMRPVSLFDAQASAAAVRRLASRVKRIDRLVRVARADAFGRPPLPSTDFPAGDWLLKQADDLNIGRQAPKPIVLGRHLLTLGVAPGPDMGDLLAQCYEAQLDGRFSTLEEGLVFAEGLLAP